MPELRLRLTLDISYCNAEVADAAALRGHLESAVQYAIGRGLLTGESAFEVDDFRYAVDVIAVDDGSLPSEEAITEFLAAQFEAGHTLLEDMPRRAARYGLMPPAMFQLEMRERIEMAREEIGAD